MKDFKINIPKAVSKHFFDFLMLFLAISLGFLVDNYRERKGSEQLASTLAVDLITDLSADSVVIVQMLHYGSRKKKMLDSLFNLIDAPRSNENDSLIYRYSAYIKDIPWFDRHGGTINLLVNSGDMSKFTSSTSLAITDYDNECNKIIATFQHENQILTSKVYPFQQKIFHTENFESIIKKDSFRHKPDLHHWDVDTRWIYSNYTTEMRNINEKKILLFEELLDINQKTIRIIRAEYKN